MHHLFRPLILMITAAVCLACASTPAPESSTKDKEIHQSIRSLNKGTIDYIKGCYPKALQHIQEAHERFSAADELQGTADSLNSMANVYYRMDDFASALAAYDEAIAIFEQLGEATGQVRALANKSATLISAGRLEDAAGVLNQADKAAGDAHILTGLRLKTRAMLRMAQNDTRGAEDLLIQAMHAVGQSHREDLLADIHYTLARLMLTTHRAQEAVTHLDTALAIDHAAGAYFSIGQDLAALGSCHQQLAHYAEAANYYKRSLKIFALLQAHRKVQWVLPRLETCAAKAGLNLQATLHWADQWLAGRHEADLCR
jgi:tetratricopeptide (TPR) repeat protein